MSSHERHLCIQLHDIKAKLSYINNETIYGCKQKIIGHKTENLVKFFTDQTEIHRCNF